MRINELEREGILRRVPSTVDAREVYYELSPKGKDLVHVLVAVLRFAAKHEASRIFPDGQSRKLEEAYPGVDEWAKRFAPGEP
jgi:DNA-binding HxlR family transcriptional regulator